MFKSNSAQTMDSTRLILVEYTKLCLSMERENLAKSVNKKNTTDLEYLL